jgi:tetratricopeptide (TPR) repeat protein
MLSFIIAEVAYKASASLAPDDPAPLSNLSSVKFELGQYSEAVAFIQRSLELLEQEPNDEAATRKSKALYDRLAKCYMHDSLFGKARQVIDKVCDEKLRTRVRSTLDLVAA